MTCTDTFTFSFIFTSVVEEISAWIEVKHEEEAAGLMVVLEMVWILFAMCLTRLS
jgi:hypothetical protein